MHCILVDLATIVMQQMVDTHTYGIFHVAGGSRNAMSLAQLTEWCDQRFGQHPVVANSAIRPFDVPWVVMDSTPRSPDLRLGAQDDFA